MALPLIYSKGTSLSFFHCPSPPVIMMTTSLSIQRPLGGPPLRLHPSRTALWGIQASIHCLPSPLYWTFCAFGCEREEGCGAWRLWVHRRLITFFAMLSCPRHGTAILGLCWFPNAGLLIRLGWQFGARGQQGMGWVNRLDWILYMLPLLLAIVKLFVLVLLLRISRTFADSIQSST